MIFSRRAQRLNSDPLLTRPKVAEYIGRDPGRITRYVQQGLMPEPDEVLEGGAPAWRTSTIRSWWLHRGERLPRSAGRRYHQQWDDNALVPELLEEQVLDVEMTSGRAVPLHVRMYRAMDGGGPVALMGWPQHQDRPAWATMDWSSVLPQVRAALVEDVDIEKPCWLQIRAEYGPRVISGIHYGDVPPSDEIEITEIGSHHTEITPEDVERLIGMAFDVYPQELYTQDAVAARRRSGEADSATPTPLMTDTEQLQPRIRRLRVIDQQIKGAELPTDDAVRFAAGVLAAEAKAVDDQILSNEECRREFPRDDDGLPRSKSVFLAVSSQQRRLTPNEHGLVRNYELERPVVTAKEYRDPAKSWSDEEGMYRVTVRPDARDRLTGIRRLLMDPKLEETSPFREALTAAEQALSRDVYSADINFARQDRSPRELEWVADTPVMAEYLSQLKPVGALDELPFEFRRRGKLLKSYEYAADWNNPVLLFDEISGLLALRGLDPSNMDEDDARDRVRENHRWLSLQKLNGDVPPPPLTPAVEAAQIEAYLADRPKVYLEWPQAARPDGLEVFTGGRLMAPAASQGVERPLFVKTAGGSLVPVSLNGETHFRGFVWGVSGTDNLTGRVHEFLTGGVRDWRQFRDDDSASSRALEFLRGYLLESGAGQLDVDAAPIVERYQKLCGGLLRR